MDEKTIVGSSTRTTIMLGEPQYARIIRIM